MVNFCWEGNKLWIIWMRIKNSLFFGLSQINFVLILKSNNLLWNTEKTLTVLKSSDIFFGRNRGPFVSKCVRVYPPAFVYIVVFFFCHFLSVAHTLNLIRFYLLSWTFFISNWLHQNDIRFFISWPISSVWFYWTKSKTGERINTEKNNQ